MKIKKYFYSFIIASSIFSSIPGYTADACEQMCDWYGTDFPLCTDDNAYWENNGTSSCVGKHFCEDNSNNGIVTRCEGSITVDKFETIDNFESAKIGNWRVLKPTGSSNNTSYMGFYMKDYSTADAIAAEYSDVKYGAYTDNLTITKDSFSGRFALHYKTYVLDEGKDAYYSRFIPASLRAASVRIEKVAPPKFPIRSPDYLASIKVKLSGNQQSEVKFRVVESCIDSAGRLINGNSILPAGETTKIVNPGKWVEINTVMDGFRVDTDNKCNGGYTVYDFIINHDNTEANITVDDLKVGVIKD